VRKLRVHVVNIPIPPVNWGPILIDYLHCLVTEIRIPSGCIYSGSITNYFDKRNMWPAKDRGIHAEQSIPQVHRDTASIIAYPCRGSFFSPTFQIPAIPNSSWEDPSEADTHRATQPVSVSTNGRITGFLGSGMPSRSSEI
jgi:hypothetical protein